MQPPGPSARYDLTPAKGRRRRRRRSWLGRLSFLPYADVLAVIVAFGIIMGVLLITDCGSS
jgi:hypothetical protein